MNTVRAKDGTRIAYDRTGQGPALILVTGAIARRTDATTVAGKLASHFTVFTYDRRGRGDSEDTPPYAVAREIEDIGALIHEAGGSVFVFGHSSGAVLALEAASSINGIRKVAVYEPPLMVDGTAPLLPQDFRAQLSSLLSAGRTGDMLALWMATIANLPAEALAQMRQQPSWAAMEDSAPTLLYDLAITEDNLKGRPFTPELARRLASLRMPALVMAGGASPQWMRNTAKAVAQAIPGAEYQVLEGQTHGAADEVLVPVLVSFFNA